MRAIIIINTGQKLSNLTQAHLDKLGFTVLTAHPSRDGSKLTKKNKADLSLKNVMMPGSDDSKAV